MLDGQRRKGSGIAGPKAKLEGLLDAVDLFRSGKILTRQPSNEQGVRKKTIAGGVKPDPAYGRREFYDCISRGE